MFLLTADDLASGSNRLVFPCVGWLVDLAKAHASVLLILGDGGRSTAGAQVLGMAKPVGVGGSDGSAHRD